MIQDNHSKPHQLSLVTSQKDRENTFALFEHCDDFLFSDFQRMQEALKKLQQSIPNKDVVTYLRYINYSALFDNQYYKYQESYDKFQEGLKLLDSIAIYKDKAAFLIDYIGTCINLDKLEEASNLIVHVDQLLNERPNAVLRARLTCREGNLNNLLSDLPNGIRLLLDALNQFNELPILTTKDYYFISLIFSGLGLIYEKVPEPAKAKEAYSKTIEICKKNNLNTRLSWHYLNAGKAHAMLSEIPQAINYFKTALQNTNDQNINAKAAAYANWGYCLFKENFTDYALKLYQKAEKVYNLYPEKNCTNSAIIAKWKGLLFAQANDFEKSFRQYRKAIVIAKKAKNYGELANISDEISSLHADQGHYKEAYKYQLLKAEYEAQHAESINTRIVRELNIKYATERKKQEIENLEYQAKALQLRALRAQMNPHFLFNALNSIQNFITQNSQEEAISYLASFSKLIRKSLDYSELETISLEKEIDFLKHYLYINKHLRFRDRLDYEIIVNPELLDEDYEIPSMIVQPYVENSIEHGLRNLKEGLITVTFDLFDQDTIRCTISDNGVGRENAAENKNMNPNLQLHKSKGTHITLDRLSMLDSKHKREDLVKIEDNFDAKKVINCGTKVTVLIPL